ncbi:Hypothetical predicted protein, partial [Paramuricea clavata]
MFWAFNLKTFKDEPEAEPSEENAVLQELRELKDLMKSIKAKQSEMEKTLVRITKQLDTKDFELAKSSHAANVTKICAKAYIQLGRFQKPNESKTEQLRQEFANSPYGLTVQELLLHAERFEKAKFTYWRAEERRRILAVGTWSSLRQASTRELAAKICGLLGVKFNVVLETTVRRNIALV